MKTTRKRKNRGRWPVILLWVFVGVPAAIIGLIALVNYVVMPLVTQQRREVEVPSVVGLARDKAVELLTRAGFRVGELRIVTDSLLAAEHVVSQHPAPGRRTKPGKPVDLDISRGSDRLAIPDLAGMSLAAAQVKLEEVGLVLAEVESLRMPNLPVGRVITTRPAAGTVAPLGTPVVVAVSAPVGSFPMPNLIGMNVETASGIIASQGLLLGEVKHAPSEEPDGMVLIQYPEEGSPVRDRDTCRLIVASPVVEDSAR